MLSSTEATEYWRIVLTVEVNTLQGYLVGLTVHSSSNLSEGDGVCLALPIYSATLS